MNSFRAPKFGRSALTPLLLTPEEIIDTIIDAGAKSPQQILDALRDGQALAALEITDSDQQAVEDAYAMVNARHPLSNSSPIISSRLSRSGIPSGNLFANWPRLILSFSFPSSSSWNESTTSSA